MAGTTVYIYIPLSVHAFSFKYVCVRHSMCVNTMKIATKQNLNSLWTCKVCVCGVCVFEHCVIAFINVCFYIVVLKI